MNKPVLTAVITTPFGKFTASYTLNGICRLIFPDLIKKTGVSLPDITNINSKVITTAELEKLKQWVDITHRALNNYFNKKDF